jgi:hypothetical protein
MPGKVGRDAILRLRQVGELEARRGLAEAEAQLAAARAAHTRAVAVATQAAARLAAGGTTDSTVRASRLAAREQYRGAARQELRVAEDARLAAARRLLRAETALDGARKKLETAARAKEAATQQVRADKLALARGKARREERASDDAWRRR